ncbi:MAG: GUN4 N-terminal ARM-like repeat domain-containing protein [Spirulinaceae cyanobacterium]
MTEQNIVSVQNPDSAIAQLEVQLRSESGKNQLKSIPQLVQAGEPGLEVLQEFLLQRQLEFPDLVAGKVYQVLYQSNDLNSQEFLQTHFPTGLVPLQTDKNIDYQPLQKLLAQQDFQAADRLTLEKLCQLVGVEAQQRNWLYFTEVAQLPVTDLQTINNLWLSHSEGKFGFSVQREIWLGVGKDFSSLWHKINWKQGNTWTRYPGEFTWTLQAPKGHLPLSNQLRGTRVIAALLSHQAWSKKS